MMKQVKTSIILAGGEGARIQSVTQNKLPKCLLKVKEKEILEQILDNFVDYGISQIVLALGFHRQKIEYFLHTYRKKANIITVIEKEPLGTGGAIKNAIEFAKINESFFLTNGDTLNGINLREMDKHWNSIYLKGALMALAPTFDPFNNRVVEMGLDYTIARTKLYPSPQNLKGCLKLGEKYLVNAGLYIMETEIVKKSPEEKFPINALIYRFTQSNLLYGFPTLAQHFNIGTSEEYERAEKEWNPRLSEGLIEIK